MLFVPKAKIKIADKKGGGGLFSAVVSALGFGDGCKCQFNPSEFTIQRNVNYSEQKVLGANKPILQFVNGGAEILSFSLFFDTYSTGLSSVKPTLLKDDVRKYTQPIYELMDVNEDLHAPSKVKFEWGKINFTGYIIDIKQRFTFFSATGIPLRAVLEITMKSTEKDNNVRNSPDRTKHRVIKSGDALYSFAFAEYDDPGEWRRIAEANDIDNPRRLKSGKNLVVPAII